MSIKAIGSSTLDVNDVQVCVGSSLVKVRKIIKDGVSLYQRDIPYDGLKFTANTNGSSVKIEKQSDAPNVNLFVSYDGRNWTSYTVGNIVTLEKAGDYVYFKAGPGGNSSMGSSMYSNNRFVMTGSISASGNVMSILDASLLKNDVGYYCFCSLFKNCDSLTTAPSLPATTLNDGCCYMGMFDGCKNLISAPELPAMNVSQQSYLSMFRGCENLTNVPLLPATKAGFLSYSAMFIGCSNLRGIPVIKANTLSSYCFDSMFNGCGSINGVNLPVGCGYYESIHGSFATDHTITVFYI